jgi:glycine cleavage system H protein
MMAAIKYHPEHTWIRVEGNMGTIGITDYAQTQLGEIVYVDLPNIGSSFNKEEIFGTVEALKTASDLFMPASGKVTEVNGQLNKQPILVNESAFEDGWMMKVALSDLSELDGLLSEEDYQKLIR